MTPNQALLAKVANEQNGVLLAQLRARLVAYDAEITKAAKNLDPNQQYMIMVQGVPVKFDDTNGLVSACSMENATRFSYSRALQLASRVTNGNGQRGEVKVYSDQLYAELRLLADMIKLFTITG